METLSDDLEYLQGWVHYHETRLQELQNKVAAQYEWYHWMEHRLESMLKWEEHRRSRDPVRGPQMARRGGRKCVAVMTAHGRRPEVMESSSEDTELSDYRSDS